MIRNVLESIGGIQIFPIISLVLFVAVFGGMFWWTMRMRRSHVDHMGGLPLEDDHSQREEK